MLVDNPPDSGFSGYLGFRGLSIYVPGFRVQGSVLTMQGSTFKV